MQSASVSSSSGPLRGLRVIEMGAFVAAPYCGQLLADLGADVVKIEPPASGDPMRQWSAHPENGQSLWWPLIGRNKRSVTLDLRRPEARPVAIRLIEAADVLIENFRPGTLERWGLDPTELLRLNPKLIVARISGFGQSGALRDRPGFAAVAEAMSGLRHLTGYPDRAPTRVGISIGDSLAGLFAALGVTSALNVKCDGVVQGQVIDVAITESVLAVMESTITEFSALGRVRERTGAVLAGIAPSNLYPTAAGGGVVIAANADGLFARLARLIGQPELASDPRYDTHVARGRNQAELDGIVAAWTAAHERDDLLAWLAEAGIPSGPVNTAAEVAVDPHLRARDAIIEVETTAFGRLAMQGVVPKLAATPGAVRWSGPELGAHTEEVLAELGLPSAERRRLRAEGVV